MKLPHTQGARLLHELFLRGKPIYTRLEIIAAANVQKVHPKQLNKVISRLTQQGRLLRLKRGLYSPVPTIPEHAYPHPFILGTQLIAPSAISHASALYYHGLIETPPKVITLITPKNKLKKHSITINSLTYSFKQVKPADFIGIEKVWLDETKSGYVPVPITNKEKTILDCLIQPKLCGGMGALAKIIEKSKGSIDLARLWDYMNQHGKKSVNKRLAKIMPER